jgi:PIN domain nuclease of toxin-antitoxin system
MKILLDTHVLLWALYKSSKLPADVVATIESEENEIYFSVASLWEIQIKHDKHPEAMPYAAREVMADALELFELLNIAPVHIFDLSILKDIHNDPFDRLLIIQAKCEDMKLLTADGIIPLYGYSYIMPFRVN